MATYYKTTWWQNVRQMVYAYREGICTACGENITGAWQVHHAEGAYEFLYREDFCIELMWLVHPVCHLRIEREKTRKRKSINQQRKNHLDALSNKDVSSTVRRRRKSGHK